MSSFPWPIRSIAAADYGRTRPRSVSPPRRTFWAAVRRDAVPGGTIFLSRLHEALSLTEKEEDHVIISPTANVTPETGHIVVPGSIEWVTE